ncbi:MAG: hypothetical protein QXO57_01900 [Candidatus Aenigmatarchaeota archaeon]
MGILTGLIVVFLGLLIYTRGFSLLTDYLCPSCSGINILNPACHLKQVGCKNVIPTFLGIGFIIVGLVLMTRR